MQKTGKRRFVVSAIALVLVVCCAACDRLELYGNLSEEDANEMLVLLSEKGISAQKKKEVRQNEVFYSILVDKGSVSAARTLLVEHRLPRRRQLGLTGVYKDKGLIPTPDEQKARFLLALKGEIINSLERVPDVVDADVVLNVPVVDEFTDAETKKLKRPTASVVIKVKPSSIVHQTITEAKIQQFVANSVEGLNPRDVAVIISYLASAGEPTVRPGDVVSLPSGLDRTAPAAIAAAPALDETIIGLTLDAESKGRLKLYLLIFFVVLLVLSAVLILVIMHGSRMRREIGELRGHGGHVEGEVLSEGPRRIGAPMGGAGQSGEMDVTGDREEVYDEGYGPDNEQR